MKRLLPVLFILISFSQLLKAQTTPEEHIEKFFTDFKLKGAEKAVENIYETNKWISKFEDGIDNLKKQLESYDKDLVGEYYGYEFITKKELGESYVLYSYLAKYDRQPLRFTFQFYKPKDKWFLYAFQFDDKFDEELEKAAEIYFLTR